MFFILSKTAAFLLLPSNLLIMLGLAGAALLATPFKRAGARLMFACLMLLAMAGFLPVGGLLIHAWKAVSRLGIRRAVRQMALSYWVAA